MPWAAVTAAQGDRKLSSLAHNRHEVAQGEYALRKPATAVIYYKFL
jgi:hypothetical protein